MQVIPNRPTQAPGVCFICETSPDVPHVDTLKNFDPPGPSSLRGRKYDCLWCAEEFAKLFGFLTNTKRIEIENELAALKDKIKDLEPKADLVEAINTAAEIVAAGHTAKAERDAAQAQQPKSEIELGAELHAAASAQSRRAAKAQK